MTRKLYEDDSYCRRFSAVVVSCTPGDGAYDVILDQTAFFPEGGGQAADEGVIDGIRVLDVQSDGDEIIHKTEREFSVGQRVEGCIDWDVRYERMQSHSGEHVFSGVVHSIFGYSNIGFHMGERVMTVDFSGPLSQSDIEHAELAGNRAIYKNADITASYPERAALEKLDYRSKIDVGEHVRIVTIEDIDCCACCAPHVKRTGEIGMIKVIGFYPHRKGTRVELVAGINALRDYSGLNAANKRLRGLLSAPREGVFEAVEEQLLSVQTLKSENQRISRKLALYELKKTQIGDAVYSVADRLGYDQLRYCANSITDDGVDTCILLSRDDDKYLYVVSSKSREVKEMVAELNRALDGKGGGKGNYAQGSVMQCDEEHIKAVVEEILK